PRLATTPPRSAAAPPRPATAPPRPATASPRPATTPPSTATAPPRSTTTAPLSTAIISPRTTSDAITTLTSNEEIARMHSIEKHELRAITKKAMNIKVPEDAVRRAIELYDLEKSYTEQPEEVMDEVEQIFKMKGIQWPTPHYRCMMIS